MNFGDEMCLSTEEVERKIALYIVLIMCCVNVYLAYLGLLR